MIFMLIFYLSTLASNPTSNVPFSLYDMYCMIMLYSTLF